MKKIADMLLLLITVFASILICDICIPQQAYETVRDWGKSNRGNGRNNYEYSCTGNSYETRAIPIITDIEITQVIGIDADMLEDDELVVGIVFGTYNRVNQGEVNVELRQGNSCCKYQYSMDDLVNLEMCYTAFPTEELQAGEARIVLWTDEGVNDNCVAAISAWNAGINDRNKNDINNFRHTKESEFFGEMFVGEEIQRDKLMMELFTR